MKNSVFISIYCESNFYKNYEGISETKKQSIIPLVLMMNRWDGKIGFRIHVLVHSRTRLRAPANRLADRVLTSRFARRHA